MAIRAPMLRFLASDASDDVPEAADLTRRLRTVFDAPGYRPPMLPQAALELLQLSQKPNVQFDDVIRLLERDPVLAGKVLSLAQSAFYASRSPILSLRQAAVRLGLATLRDLVLEASLHLRVFRVPGYEKTMERLSRHATATAHVVRVVCARTLVDAEYAFLCGLLHDVGFVACLLALSENRALHALPFETLAPALNEAHQEASGLLARLWKLPAPIQRVVATHHEVVVDGAPQQVNAALVIAEHLTWEAGAGILAPPPEARPLGTEVHEPPLDGIDSNWTGVVEEARAALEMDDLGFCAARAESWEVLGRLGLA